MSVDMSVVVAGASFPQNTLWDFHMEQAFFPSRPRSSPMLQASMSSSTPPRAVPSRLDLQIASSSNPSEPIPTTTSNWITDLSVGLQMICGSPPPNFARESPLNRVSTSSSDGGVEGSDPYGRLSPSTPISTPTPTSSPSSRPILLTPSRPTAVNAGLVAAVPMFIALSPVCSECFPQKPIRHHRRSTPSPPVVVVGLPPIPEPTTAESPPMATVVSPPPVVGRSRVSERGTYRRTVSLVGAHHVGRNCPHSSSRSRPIIVRHVETRERLDKQLSSICSSKSSGPETAAPRPDVTSGRSSALPWKQWNSCMGGASSVHRLSSINGGVRLKVNVAPYQPEDIVVTVAPVTGNDGRRVSVAVEAIQGGNGEVPSARRLIHHSDLLLSSDSPKRLLCHVTSGGWMYLRERCLISKSAHRDSDGNESSVPGEVLSVDYGHGQPTHVPVMYCNEDRLEWAFVVHVPDCFRFEDLSVKTVDDCVVIVGSGNPTVSSILYPVDGSTGPTAQSALLNSRAIRIVVPLPDGTDNRSVCASMTAKSQLIVVARLHHSSSRRYTF